MEQRKEEKETSEIQIISVIYFRPVYKNSALYRQTSNIIFFSVYCSMHCQNHELLLVIFADIMHEHLHTLQTVITAASHCFSLIIQSFYVLITS